MNIVGKFTNLSSGSGKWILMTVTNLSMSGLQFTAVGTTGINKDETLRVKFTLDGKRVDSINKEVFVRHVGKEQYGCEFINLAYEEKALGFYLFSK